jgi:hypothetical protein
MQTIQADGVERRPRHVALSRGLSGRCSWLRVQQDAVLGVRRIRSVLLCEMYCMFAVLPG